MQNGVYQPDNRDLIGYCQEVTTYAGRRGSCFSAGAAVTRPDGETVPIESVSIGDFVAGWPSASAAASGEPPRAMRVKRVQHVTEKGLALQGGTLRLLNGTVISVRPFMTPNHALLSPDGTWRAVDAASAQAEVDLYLKSTRVIEDGDKAGPARTEVGALAAGMAVLRMPTVSDLKTKTDTKLSTEAAILEAIVHDAEADEVWSLELDTVGFGAYIVNGLVVID
jgi:hypothetical protein